MIERKYIVHLGGVGLAVVLIIYASSCNPLPFDTITKIARQYYDPACYVQSLKIEPPELPQRPSLPPITDIRAVNASGTSVGTVNPMLQRIWDSGSEPWRS